MVLEGGTVLNCFKERYRFGRGGSSSFASRVCEE